MDLGLRGSRALVTGGSRGLGRAIAARLIEEGASVALCARDADGVARAAEELGATFAAPCDVTDAEALTAWTRDAAAALGGVDLVVANAGGASGGARLEQTEAEDWASTFALNVEHSTTLTRAALPHLRESDHASVVYVSSISGFRPQPKSQYAAAKAALIHLAASLARELGPEGIRVNALSPGSILFPGGSWARRARETADEFQAFVEAEFPFGRLGHAEEVADAAAYLLSRRASWVSGTNLVVDGAQNQPGMGGF